MAARTNILVTGGHLIGVYPGDEDPEDIHAYLRPAWFGSVEGSTLEDFGPEPGPPRSQRPRQRARVQEPPDSQPQRQPPPARSQSNPRFPSAEPRQAKGSLRAEDSLDDVEGVNDVSSKDTPISVDALCWDNTSNKDHKTPRDQSKVTSCANEISSFPCTTPV